MKTKINLVVILASIIMISVSGCKKDDKKDKVAPKLTIDLSHLAGTTSFSLNNTYVNEAGNSFNVTKFKYYLSNFRFVLPDNSEVSVPESYYLIDQEDSGSRELHFENLIVGNYKSVKFMIGIDSTRNVSGAQEGILSAEPGMFWSWNTGYIFFKIEGTSPSIPTTGNEFVYHIGGFQGAFVNNREVEISFDGDHLELADDAHPELHLVLNVMEVFKNPHTIDLTTFPSNIQMPNANASMIADNYENMFRYDHIHH